MARPRKRIIFAAQTPAVPGAPPFPSSTNSTLRTREKPLAWALPILFALVSCYYEDLPNEVARGRSKLARVCKTVDIVLRLPIISTFAYHSTTALSLFIAASIFGAATACLLPRATDLIIRTWEAALATLHLWAQYCLVCVLKAVLHELQATGNRREEEGRSQIQHLPPGTGIRPEESAPTCEELAETNALQHSKGFRLSPQPADGPNLEESQAPPTTGELAATDMVQDPQESRLAPQLANGPSLEKPQAPTLSAEREAEKRVTRSHRLRPTPSGTALPLALVRECLLHIAVDFPEEDREATLRAACLASKTWRDESQPYLFAIIDLLLQDDSARPLRLLATLLEFRRLAKYTLQLTLKVKGAALVNVAAAASLFGDFTRMQSLSLTFSWDELGFLGPHWALHSPLRYLSLHGPISSLMMKIICYLHNLERLTLDGPFVDGPAVRRQPTFELEKLSISRDLPQIAIYRLTLLSFATLTKLTLTASDSEQAPELSYLVSLRELEILQPYRDAEPVKNKQKTVKNKPLDARAIATYVERLLASARRLPQLRCLALLNPWDLQGDGWPDLRSKSASILKALPESLVVLNLTSAVMAINFDDLYKLVRNPKSRPVNLQVVAMDQEAKGSLPVSAQDLERDWAENGIEISWTRCRVHANFPPLVMVSTETETTGEKDSCH